MLSAVFGGAIFIYLATPPARYSEPRTSDHYAKGSFFVPWAEVPNLSKRPSFFSLLFNVSLAVVARYIEANSSERIALKDLALVAELSVFRLVTVFRREMGVSPYRYLNAVRVRKAQVRKVQMR